MLLMVLKRLALAVSSLVGVVSSITTYGRDFAVA